MENNWKDNSSIYKKSHSHFYMYILYPVILLLVVVCIFLFVGYREVTVDAIGLLEPTETELVQASNSGEIVDNFLEENKEVKTGDTLLVFDEKQMKREEKEIQTKLDELNEQKEELYTLKESITNEVNYFEGDDPFGYSEIVNNFLEKKENNEDIVEILTGTEKSIEEENELISNMLEDKKKTLSNTEGLREALKNNDDSFHTESEKINNQFDFYSEQINSSLDKEREKTSILSNLDSQIDNIEGEILNLELEISNNSSSISSLDQQISTSQSKNDLTKSEKLAEIASQIQAVEDEITTNQSSLNEMEVLSEKNKVVAKSDGIIHINEEYKSTSSVTEGTVLAEILPNLEKDTVEIVTAIPASDMTNVEVGMQFTFTLDVKGVSEKALRGKITEIASNSTQTEKGVFYQVKGSVIEIPESTPLRFGLAGEVSLIVGEKTYFNYFKDKIF
ncbi:bacteriocin secretion accessory protein [Virgibacillus xinjiangensis]|uniref:Bacteriocin secretion accessory protein n=1 Tax=Virgibacillus xinjiangensis TaxID=393090 RepID=A0ABV7CSQ8_9BACI